MQCADPGPAAGPGRSGRRRRFGKCGRHPNTLAIQTAERLRQQDSRPARRAASDALRELQSTAVPERMRP